MDAILEDFNLFVDSDPNVHVLYYIPKTGYISVDGAEGNDPRPRFAVNHRYVTRGYFEGETMSYLGGSLSTNGSRSALTELQDAASSRGYTIEPAPVNKVTTRLLVGARELVEAPDGTLRLDVDCKRVPGGTRADGTPFQVDQCTVKGGPEGNTYDMGTEVMYRVVAVPYHGATIGGAIPFQGVTMPGWDGLIDEKLASGDSWDNVLQANVEWELEGERRTHKAVLNINWSSVFEQASAFAAVHNWSCVDVEVEAFFQNIATCQGTTEQCGVSIQWFDARGNPTNVPDNNADFVNATKELQRTLEDEIFAQVRADSSVLGRVSTETSAAFTLRANYEKRSLSRNERREFYWNPGSKTVLSSTNLTIDCVKGSAGSRLGWDDSDYCRSLLGLATSR